LAVSVWEERRKYSSVIGVISKFLEKKGGWRRGGGKNFQQLWPHHGVTYSSENPVYNVVMINYDHDINPVKDV
jgi:hypothetical protein